MGWKLTDEEKQRGDTHLVSVKERKTDSGTYTAPFLLSTGEGSKSFGSYDEAASRILMVAQPSGTERSASAYGTAQVTKTNRQHQHDRSAGGAVHAKSGGKEQTSFRPSTTKTLNTTVVTRGAPQAVKMDK